MLWCWNAYLIDLTTIYEVIDSFYKLVTLSNSTIYDKIGLTIYISACLFGHWLNNIGLSLTASPQPPAYRTFDDEDDDEFHQLKLDNSMFFKVFMFSFEVKASSWRGANFGKAHTHFPNSRSLKLFQYLERFSHKMTKHSSKNAIFVRGHFGAE